MRSEFQISLQRKKDQKMEKIEKQRKEKKREKREKTVALCFCSASEVCSLASDSGLAARCRCGWLVSWAWAAENGRFVSVSVERDMGWLDPSAELPRELPRVEWWNGALIGLDSGIRTARNDESTVPESSIHPSIYPYLLDSIPFHSIPWNLTVRSLYLSVSWYPLITCIQTTFYLNSIFNSWWK